MTTESQERNPYIGPRPFEQEDRDFFFGRDREAGELISLVFAHRALLLYAQSGAGKTSLLNAGLIPLLKEEGFEVLPLARVRGLIPEDIEPDEIPNLYVFNTLMSWAEDEADPRKLAQTSLASFLKEREHPTDEEGLPSPRIIIFDQFEELFAFYPERWRDRERFFEQIRDALEDDPLLRAIFVIREDYIAQLDPFTSLLPEKLRTRFRMERLRKGAGLAAVKGPLRDMRRSFAEGVAEQLVEELLKVRVETAARETEEVTGQFIEPVQLQVVCQSLWRDLPPDVTVITEGHLQAFGDVDQALSGFYERSIKEATQRPIVNERDLRLWFERGLITPAGTRGTVYRGGEETGGIPNTAVDVLENLHLIRGEWRAGARWYELTHDRFIEPIQRSNETWRVVRRDRWLRIGGGVMAVLILFFVGIAALQAIEDTHEAWQTWRVQATATAAASQSQATATAAAAELSEAKATAQQSQATAIVAAADASEAKATATAAAAESSDLAISVLRARVRPLKPGLSVSVETTTAGTIGAFVRDAAGDFYLLTAGHVLGAPNCELGSPVLQPGRYDGGTLDDVVGYVARCLPLDDRVPVANDVGLARLKEGISFETVIPGIGPIRAVREPTLGMSVRKLGRTTGLATGQITQVNVTKSIYYGEGQVFELVNCIVTSAGMSEAGDAGALVVDEEGYAIGIIIGGSQSSTILAPIQDALDSLGVQLVDTVP